MGLASPLAAPFVKMTSGRSKSCGCSQYPKGKDSPAYKHGRSRTREYDLELHMMKNYGLDLKDYQKLLEAQNHKCAICGSPPPNNRKTRLSIDHCHKTGKVRGLLCDRCNRSIGLLKDDVSILKKAIEYLNKE
ncbi:recombination endonuclease VII [bacterium]|nr:recombination endonuclease VII [bacterium]